jgi:hypothetical protein
MNKDRLKLIVRNLELLIDSLKAEIYSDTSFSTISNERRESILDYDEVFNEDDDD